MAGNETGLEVGIRNLYFQIVLLILRLFVQFGIIWYYFQNNLRNTNIFDATTNQNLGFDSLDSIAKR